jgi:amino acid permease
MASKKSESNKPQKNTREAAQMLIYRIVFIVISLMLLFSLVLSAVTF